MSERPAISMLVYAKPLRFLKPFPTEELLSLESITWFSNLAADNQLEGTQFLPDRSEAVALAESDLWADYLLEMRNELTAFLAARHSQNYTEWNNTAVAVRDFYVANIEPKVVEELGNHRLPESLKDRVAWDVVSALQEIAFSQFRIPRFFDRLLAVYRRGHLPCHGVQLELTKPDPRIVLSVH